MNYYIDLITVIIPVYNVKSYLTKCVESVINQTYKNLEIILVDDGSTDNSGILCDNLKLKDNRISVIHKKNSGLGFARNSGLEISTGKYITFVDSDDYIEPMAIECLYKGIIKNQVDECKMGFQRFKNNGSIAGKTKYKFELFPGTEARTKYAPRLIGSSPIAHDSIEMCVCGAIFNGDIIRKNNLSFPSERELISEDLIFQLEYLQYADGACLIEETEYKYRINDKSLSQSYNPKRMKMSYIFYKDVEKRLRTYGYGEEEINRAKRMFFIHLRMSISQEVMYKEHSPRRAIRNISKLCHNKNLIDVINSYPIYKLGFSQRIFLKCIINKKAFTLWVLKKLNLY